MNADRCVYRRPVCFCNARQLLEIHIFKSGYVPLLTGANLRTAASQRDPAPVAGGEKASGNQAVLGDATQPVDPGPVTGRSVNNGPTPIGLSNKENEIETLQSVKYRNSGGGQSGSCECPDRHRRRPNL